MEKLNLIVYGGGPSGMRLDGGGPFYVAKLHKRGRARLSGIRIGDEVSSINGFPCNRMDLQEAQDLVSNTSDIRLQILRRFWKICPEEYNMDELETDSSGFYSPLFSKNITHQITSPISFRTTNQTGSTTIPIYITEETGLPQDVSIKQHEYFQSCVTSPLSADKRPTKRHVSRLFLIPENNKIKQKEIRLFQSQIDPILIKSNFKDEVHFDIPKSTISNSFEIRKKLEPKSECLEQSKDWRQTNKAINDHKIIPSEEVIIWSSKKLPSPETERLPLNESQPWKPRPFPTKINLLPPTMADSSPIEDPDTSKVVVNEELIDAGLLTRGFVTAGGVPVEMHLETKKLYSDSSFYQDPCHKYPTIEEQIKMARKVANLLTSNTGHIGKGQKMFLKRQEMSSKWVTHLDPLVEAEIKEEQERKNREVSPGHVGEGPFDQLSRAKRAAELEKMRLKEEKSLHDVVPFDLCSQLANELQNFRGRGGKLFAKIKAKAEDWVVSGNDPKLSSRLQPFNQEPKNHKDLIQFTPLKHPFTPTIQPSDKGTFSEIDWNQSQGYHPPPNKLKDMINNPKPALTPWDSVVETGSVDRAFEHLHHHHHHRHCDDDQSFGSYNMPKQQYGYINTSSLNPLIHLNGYSSPSKKSEIFSVDTRSYSPQHVGGVRPVHFRPH